MLKYYFEGVNDAFAALVSGVHEEIIPTQRQPSRNGDVLHFDGATASVCFSQPHQRVLLNPGRDCNPFFHLYEALWMLVGRQDVAPLAYYNSNMANYSDDGVNFNAAYGHRWRNWGGIDQLNELVEHLTEFPISRRAVLQMWDPVKDLLKVDDRNKSTEHRGKINPGQSKDVACNITATFRVSHHKLHMNVHNRSNDLIWGMLGANVVHFSMLLEYMACALGYEIGTYTVTSDNLHIYTNKWEPEKYLAQYKDRDAYSPPSDYSHLHHYKRIPLLTDKRVFDKQCRKFVEHHSKTPEDIVWGDYKNDFLNTVAQPMMNAFHFHKLRMYAAAITEMNKVEMWDWQTAGYWWIESRRRNWQSKPKPSPVEELEL